MIRDIVKDTSILQTKSEKAQKDDLHIIQDLIDTAEHYKDRCCGLAAIQINEPKRIIVAYNGEKFIPMINPMIIHHSNERFKSEEGCMSIDGIREVTRYKDITVMFKTPTGKINKRVCKGFFGEIVQHEVDHCNGILI